MYLSSQIDRKQGVKAMACACLVEVECAS